MSTDTTKRRSRATHASRTSVIGFDLDLTLVDARPGIAATYRELVARTGVHVDIPMVLSRLGPPLRTELAHWFPPGRIEEAVDLFRALYPEYAIEPSRLMPGAAAALQAVRQRHGRIVVVTSKLGRLAQLHLDHLRVVADEVVGDRFGEGKAEAISAEGIQCYVGDHVADVQAARAAGVTAVGVATGPCSEAELRAAGAGCVLADLRHFPAWLGNDGQGTVR